MSSLNPGINSAIDSGTAQARELRESATAGVRSGYNQLKSAGWNKLFGLDHLKAIPGIHRNHRDWGKALTHGYGGAEGLANASKPIQEQFVKQVGEMNAQTAGDIGSQVWKFASGHGYTGFGRAGAIGARAGMLAGVAAAADFLNPFGFGSIKD